jgi:hypothetical protein
MLSDYSDLSIPQQLIDESVAEAERKWFPEEFPLDSEPKPSVEATFAQHAEKWESETTHISSPAKRIMHPSYQAILGMGEAVVPFMLRDLRDNRHAWFWALSYLTKENPIGPDDAGKMDQMISAWVQWGKIKGIL